MSETIEKKCIEKGVKLTEQRRIIARVISESKEHTVSPIIPMLMNYIVEYLK